MTNIHTTLEEDATLNAVDNVRDIVNRLDDELFKAHSRIEELESENELLRAEIVKLERDEE